MNSAHKSPGAVGSAKKPNRTTKSIPELPCVGSLHSATRDLSALQAQPNLCTLLEAAQSSQTVIPGSVGWETRTPRIGPSHATLAAECGATASSDVRLKLAFIKLQAALEDGRQFHAMRHDDEHRLLLLLKLQQEPADSGGRGSVEIAGRLVRQK